MQVCIYLPDPATQRHGSTHAPQTAGAMEGGDAAPYILQRICFIQLFRRNAEKYTALGNMIISQM